MTSAATMPRQPLCGAIRTGASGTLRKLSFPALGTICEVQYVAPASDNQAGAFERAVVAWVEAFEAKYSRFRPTSLVSRINAAAGHSWVAVDDDMSQLLSLCDILHSITNGVLDPTALPLIKLWNWKAEHPVIADTCLHAGVLSTTAFVLGPSEGIKFIRGFPRVEGLLAADSCRTQTPGFFNHVVSS